MKIKSKLSVNSLIILVLMAVIGTASIVGIRFIQKNIFTLTQKSTPYQIKTLNHQRALQAHASNLLKVAASDSFEEFKQNVAKSAESLAEEIKSAEELVEFGSTSDYATDAISENTGSIHDITQKRLQLQRDTQTAVIGMRQSLLDASKRLQGLDASIRKLQQGSAKNMVSNIGITSNENRQAGTLAMLRDGLKDVTLYVSQVKIGTEKETVENLHENLAGPINNMYVYLKTIRWSDQQTGHELAKKLGEMSAKLTEAKDDYLKFLATRDASFGAKAAQATLEAEQAIAYIQTFARMEIAKTNSGLESSSEEMSTSISVFSGTNTVLILASGIIFSSAVIDSQINYGLSVKNLADFDKTVQAIDSEFNGIDGTAQRLTALLAKGKFRRETTLLADSLAALATVRQGFLGKDGAAEKIRASLKNVDEVAKLNLKMKEMVTRQMEQSGKDVVVAQQSQEKAVASVRAAVKTTVTLIIAIAVIAVVLSIVLSRWIISSITRPIDELTSMAEGFGSGDFNFRMDESRKDEFGTLALHFNQATVKLFEFTRHLQEAIRKLTSSSATLLGTADKLYTGAREQASQADQSATAMAEISQTVTDVARNARHASDASTDAHKMATSGKAIVADSVNGMNDIADSVSAVACTVGKLSAGSEQIGIIVNTIEGIADQTNLLALNAAIEAARAGDQGLGFAVVADEVRKLALRTAQATTEIGEIIQQVQGDTEKAVRAIKTGSSRVDEGVKQSGAASESLEAIVVVSARGMEMARMIATATDDQSAASEEVSHSMEQIVQISDSMKGYTEEVKIASEELSTLAEELDRMASWFKAAN